MRSTDSVESKFKLHVSFAEADIEFVDNLLAVLGELERFGLSVTPEGHGDAVDWVHDAGGLIEAADAIVYVLSPASVEFPTMAYEAERAGALSKRMVPIISQLLGKADLPAALADTRPVRMETEQLFKSNLRSLIRLLDQDAGWIRSHTQLFLKARAWRDNAHDKAFLLSGAEVSAAKAWTFERSADAPKPTDLHIAFIEASETALTGVPNGAQLTYPPAAGRRARRKPNPVVPLPQEAIIESNEPAETEFPPIEKTARTKRRLWQKFKRKPKTPAKPVADELKQPAYVPEDAHKQAHSASPIASVVTDISATEPPPVNAAAAIRPAEDAAKPEIPPIGKTARTKPRLWQKFKRKPKTPAKPVADELEKPACVPEDAGNAAHSAIANATAPADLKTVKSPPVKEAAEIKPAEHETEADGPRVKETTRLEPGLWTFKRKPKMPVRTVTVDLDKLAYVPEALKILRTSDSQLKQPPAKPAALPNVTRKDSPLVAPAGTENPETRPDNEAARTRLPKEVAEPEGQPEPEASDTKESPLKTAPKSKTAHSVIIAQDELDGLLSSLLAEADSDRS
ncbi:MAG: hypothetical protein HKN11_05055 [Rhizobiales bacterium]|nr:hypothetical protein [Hyphomicrobiales bacterium]